MDMPITTSVSSSDFAMAMKARWQTLGNTTSPALEALWVTIGNTFNDAISGASQFTPDTTWRVLEPPTGTGKTQGVCVYAALAMRKNVLAAHPLGMLVVTRTIAQADEIVATIEALVSDGAPGRTVIAKHSESTSTVAEMRGADVLVICHEAYVRSLAADRWRDFTETDYGGRSLTVIDEALAGIIDERQTRLTDISCVLGYLSPPDRRAYPKETCTLESLYNLLEVLGENSCEAPNDAPKMRVAWRDGNVVDLSPIRELLATKPFDVLSGGRRSNDQRREIASSVDATLRACEGLLSSWAYYAKKSADHTLNNADLIIPPNLPGVVVLDATASQNMIWSLMDSRAVRIPTPSKARRYDNVTLHVARTSSGLGKTAMRDRGGRRIPRLLAELERKLDPTRKLLLVCHKLLGASAQTYTPNFSQYSVATYGAIDGKNDWQDHDAVVIFGMFNRPDTWSRNAFMALQGLQDDDWLNGPSQWKGFTDIRREMEQRQLTVSIVQAVNRVRCRRVVDAEGNCLPTDVFIVLPANTRGDAVLDHILEEMPGVAVEPWDYDVDGPAERVRRGSCHEALVMLMEGQPKGDMSMADVGRELSLHKSTIRNLKSALAEPDHPLTKALADIGVVYRVQGTGRAARAKLVKTI